MATYVAFLRAINLGAHRMFPMAELIPVKRRASRWIA